MNIRILAMALIGSLASPAMAQDFDWNGFYLGVHGGAGAGTIEDVANPSATPKNLSGYLGGVQAGFNVQTDNGLVFGIEGDWSAANIGEDWYGRDTNEFDAYYGSDRITSLGTLRGRLGFASGQFLPYVTAGLAIAGTEHVLGCDANLVGLTNSCGASSVGVGAADDPGTPWEDSNTGTFVGWTIGAGAEFAVSDTISLKGEVLYGDLGSQTVVLKDPDYPQYDNREFATTFTAARLGLNFSF